MLLLKNEVTIADLTVALQEEEIKELSDLFDPCGTVIDATRIQYALDRAECEVNAAFAVTGNCGKALIKLNAKNMIIAIARYLLDTVKARPHVVEDAKRARERLEFYNVYDEKHECPLTKDQLDEILGETTDKVRDEFRHSSSKRRWTDIDFEDHQQRLFDRRSLGATRRFDPVRHWTDTVPLE